MMTLRFKARGCRLSRTDSQGEPAQGTRGYLRCEFDLDGEWDGAAASARFADQSGRAFSVPLSGGACAVPDAATWGRWFGVSLAGGAGDVRMATNGVTVMQARAPAGACAGGSASAGALATDAEVLAHFGIGTGGEEAPEASGPYATDAEVLAHFGMAGERG